MEDGEPYASFRYKQILEEQVTISYASKGISIADTDDLSPYDRKIILESIVRIKEQEKKAVDDAKAGRASPGIRNTSRFSKK